MKINPTLLITSSHIGEEVFLSYLRDLDETYGVQGMQLISEKLGLLQLDDNLSLRDNDSNILIQYNQEANWNAPDFWQEFERSKDLFNNILRDKENSLKSLLNNNILKADYNITVGNFLNILVILPTYKLSDSVLLTWLLDNFSKRKGQINTNLYFVGLLPEIETGSIKKVAGSYQRTFACLTECDAIIERQQDLVSLFSLISNKNENDQFVGDVLNIYTILKSCFSRVFESDIELLSSNRQSNLVATFDKLGIFSSLGYSTYTYKKRRLVNVLKDKIQIKIVDGLIKFSNQEIDYRNLSAEVVRYTKGKAWDDKQKLFENEEYVSFSKSNKLDNISFLAEKGTAQLLEEIKLAKSNHFDSAGGYFKVTYLPHLNFQLSEKIKKDKLALTQEIKKKFDSQGVLAYRNSLAFSYLLCGKHPAEFFKGEIESSQFNFAIARYEIADYFRDLLPEGTKKIFSVEYLSSENLLKNKYAELEYISKEIEVLEKRMYGFKEPAVSIKEQSKQHLFFNINGVDVDLSGLTEFSEALPSEIQVYTPTLPNDQRPKFIDLRNYMTPVENQLELKSCAANAVVSGFEYFVNRATNESKNFSRLFVYFNARTKTSSQNEDTGSSIFHCLESILHTESGLCTETTWPYNENAVNARPAKKAYDEALNYQALEVCSLETDLDSLKGCLAEGYPFIFGLRLFDSFQSVGARGIVPMPKQDELAHENHGLHAMLCVGYSDAERYFIVKNSWSAEWGDNGYCYIPFDYMLNKDLNLNNSFFIKKVSVLPDDFDLSRGISRDSATLFTFGADATQLELLKNQYTDLKAAVNTLQGAFESTKYEFERQNFVVLQSDSLNKSRDLKAEKILEQIAETELRINILDKDIAKVKEAKTLMLEAREKFRKVYFAILPALLLLLMVISSMLLNKYLDIDYVTSLKGATLVAVSYAIYSLLKYKGNVLNPLNEIQAQLLEAEEKRKVEIGNLLRAYDSYFEVYRQTELFKIYREFINEMNSFVNDSLIESLRRWQGKLDKYRLSIVDKLEELVFIDKFNIKHACGMSDIQLIASGINTDHLYLLNGKKSLGEFFYDQGDVMSIDHGFNKLCDEIQQFCNSADEIRILDKLSVIDFLSKSPDLLSLLPHKRGEKIESILSFLSMTSITLLSTYSPVGAISSVQNLNLSLPNLGDENSIQIIRTIKSQFLNPNENFSTSNNFNYNDSSLTFFRAKSMLPAFVISSLQEAQRSFQLLSHEEKNNIFVEERYINASLFPNEMLK